MTLAIGPPAGVGCVVPALPALGFERPLRVGDVFCVKGFTPTAPSRWAAVIDVTGAARPAARRAFLRAVAQVPETAAGEGALAPEPAAPEPEAPAPETPPSSVAHPAV
jgi:hypothetical protein